MAPANGYHFWFRIFVEHLGSAASTYPSNSQRVKYLRVPYYLNNWSSLHNSLIIKSRRVYLHWLVIELPAVQCKKFSSTYSVKKQIFYWMIKISIMSIHFIQNTCCSCSDTVSSFQSCSYWISCKELYLPSARLIFHSRKRLFGPLRQKVSISYADRSKQPEKWRMPDWNSIWGRPPRNSGRSIWRDPEETHPPADCRPAVSTAAFWPTKVKANGAPATHPSSFCGVRGRD